MLVKLRTKTSVKSKYATADSSMKTELRVDASGKVLAPAPKTPAGDSNRRPYQNDHKRKAPMPPSTSRQVATVEDEQPEERAFSYEQTLDAPALSAPGGEVLYGLNLVHPLAGVAELGPTREVVASRLVGPLDAEGER